MAQLQPEVDDDFMNSENDNLPTISSNMVSKIAGISIPVIIVLTIGLIYLPPYISTAVFATFLFFTAIFLVTKRRFMFYAMTLVPIALIFLTNAVLESYRANNHVTDLATLGLSMTISQIGAGVSSVGSGLLIMTIGIAILSVNRVVGFKITRFKYIYLAFCLLVGVWRLFAGVNALLRIFHIL